MKAGLRGLALALAVLVAIVLVFRTIHRANAPVIPALVTRDADAHRALSGSIGARIDRLFHDRPPPQANRGGNPRLIALTFDDGPYPVETPLLLDVLAELRVPATFFLIGHDSEQFPGLARRIARDGHEIANHTQTHPANFNELTPSEVTAELREGAASLDRYARDPAIRQLMRPPHGRFTEATVVTAQRDGYDVILWNDDPGDWRSVSPEAIESHMAANATAPEIVLLHSGHLNTIEALPNVVARFRAAGYQFVTVGQLLARVPTAQILHPGKLRV
ncbi:MAG: polysaccharide deacetylase family protein [Candidatus Eremiobacteraeota bacterium]|nr:polysaccharide deacetylase family protein [Candidatus Eremiobacteraeota bacterium]